MNFKIFDQKQTHKKKPGGAKKNGGLVLLLYKALIVLVSTAAIVYFMPRSNGFNFEYERNTPWRYGALMASQKFNILMSDSAYTAARDSISRTFQPYFNHEAGVLNDVKKRLKETTVARRTEEGSEKEYKAYDDPELRRYINHVMHLLDTVYTQGVIPIDTYDSLDAANIYAIRIIRDNTAASTELAEVFSPHSAYKYIMENDPDHFKQATLSELNINELLMPNEVYDSQKSLEEMEALLNNARRYTGVVLANEKIVDRGELITEETYQKIRSYEKIIEDQNLVSDKLPHIILGQTLMIFILMTMLMTFLSIFRKDYMDDMRKPILLYGMCVFFCIINSLMVSHHIFHVFVVPICMVPIIIRVFMDSRTAFMFHASMVIAISLSLGKPYEYIIMQLVAGMAAIQNLRELSQRSQIFQSAALITALYMVFYVGYELAIGTDLSELNKLHDLTYFVINGVILLFAYPLLWAIEKIFGFLSDVTLVELSNINNPLLRMMSETAPGTFQHSMQVANLASDVAKKIGARSQLVRTGALYHDIGKIEQPYFFTENQINRNPHNLISPINSAKVIIRHVTLGLALAEKHNLPSSIKRFITTHHGRGKTKFFYITYKNEHPDEEVNEDLFTYPGPNPGSAEEAILMMADSVEAASRSLQEYTEESISSLVDRIIDSQVADGFFTECAITFKDISTAKSVFKEKLKTIYHTRITYPEYNQAVKEREEEKARMAEKEEKGKKSEATK